MFDRSSGIHNVVNQLSSESKKISKELAPAVEFAKIDECTSDLRSATCDVAATLKYIEAKLNFIQKQNLAHEGSNLLVEYSEIFSRCYVPQEVDATLERAANIVMANVEHAISQAQKLMQGQTPPVQPIQVDCKDLQKLKGLLAMLAVMKKKVTVSASIPNKAEAIESTLIGLRGIVDTLNNLRSG